MLFNDRDDAGRRLAEALRRYGPRHPVVLGLPRGGVPVAFHVARALDAPLDVIVVRKLGVPGHRELAFGALGEGGVRVVNEDVVRRARLRPEDMAAVERAERAALADQARRFRAGRARLPVAGRTAILVDDGIATGATAAAACEVVRAQGASHVVMATPVAPPEAATRLAAAADELVCLTTPPGFSSVGQWYRDFSQTPDSQVISLLTADAPGLPDAAGLPDAPGLPDAAGLPDTAGPPGLPDTPGPPGPAPDSPQRAGDPP